VSSVCKVDVYAAPQVICWRGDVRSRRIRPAKHRRLMFHDLPALLGPRAQEEHCTEHDAKARQAERDVPGAADAVDLIGFGAVVGNDVCFDGAGDS
jgi:hypothetical protein